MSTTTVFTNNRSQAVRLPADVRLPENVKKVTIRAKGMSRIISSVASIWNEFFQQGPQVFNDFLPDRATQAQAEREAF
jgi:antitoxin VapB